jgi:hypothetical protein
MVSFKRRLIKAMVIRLMIDEMWIFKVIFFEARLPT